jgi:gamma-glutamyl phosphate reductase
MELDQGLVERVSCPIGVIGVVFESRPDALRRYPVFVSSPATPCS